MLYPRSKTPRVVAPLYVFIAAGILVAGLIVAHVPIPRGISQSILIVASPFLHGRDALVSRIHGMSESGESVDAVITERDALRTERAQLQRELYAAQTLAEENARLQRLLGRTREHEGSIPAAVILGPDYSPYDLFALDAGADDGVRERMLVLSPEGVAIGFIRDVRDSSSVASLFSASGVVTDALLEGTSTLHVLIEGDGGGMRFRIPRGIQVSPGMTLSAPDFTGALIGTVAHVSVTPEDAFQTVYVAPPEALYMLRYVLIDTTHAWSVPDPQLIDTANTRLP